MTHRILIIDDDKEFLQFLKKALELKKYQVDSVSDTSRLDLLIKNNHYDCIFLDLVMPGLSGLELLKKVIRKHTTSPVIILTGHGNIQLAVEALKAGAYDFIEKPVEINKLYSFIENIIQQQSIFEKSHDNEMYPIIIGESPEIKNIKSDISTIAKTNAKVLILGETGTGKELVADAIHFSSMRSKMPYIKINCAAIPSELLESELFGHRKGAFTGAYSDYNGKFLAANDGTLFLDEISDMEFRLQAKLLRVLQEDEIEIIGDANPKKINVRIIAASNQNLVNLSENGKFRPELFHRLSVINIQIPPLRKRKEDILPLTYHFLNQYNNMYNKKIQRICKTAEEILLEYSWPGNIRELKNIIENITVLSNNIEIKCPDVYKSLEMHSHSINNNNLFNENNINSLRKAKDEYEKQLILTELNRCNWKINETAKALKIDRTNLFKKMKKHGISK